jgi:serine/threonine-protein phosphatase 4 regulatory subunit 2
MNGAPKPALSATEAQEQVDVIFTQMHEFERCALPLPAAPLHSPAQLRCSTPFTIQRLCDLCANRRQHYTVAGKYLRAVEKTLLVTSTWDAFPPAPAPTGELIAGVPVPVSGARTPSANGSTPSTPLFSPIPFLHADARRSASRSPPPLALAPARAPLSEPPLPPAAGGDGTVAPRGLGLVDELDDPAPGHMSAAPTALSATTTLPDEDAGAVPAAAGEGVKAEPEDPAASLADRFVSGGKEEDADKMDLDEAGDKENQATTVNTKDEKKD